MNKNARLHITRITKQRTAEVQAEMETKRKKALADAGLEDGRATPKKPSAKRKGRW